MMAQCARRAIIGSNSRLLLRAGAPGAPGSRGFSSDVEAAKQIALKPCGDASVRVQSSRALAVGDWVMRLTYLKVTSNEREGVLVENSDGFPYLVTHNIIEAEGISATQFDKEVKVPVTTAAQLLQSAGHRPFQVSFRKKPDPGEIVEKLDEAWAGDLSPAKKKKLVKQVMTGDQRTLVGFLVNCEPTLGRSRVVDLDLPRDAPDRTRLVDHRSIESIVIERVKYVVK